MARFSSPVEAQEELDKANHFINGLLQEDLNELSSTSHTIDIWLDKYGGQSQFKEKKTSLLDYEMLKTDAELYLEFENNPN
jgi:hypothetical protein